jgi:hypothetical protein
MDLLNALLNQGGGGAVRQLAENFGLKGPSMNDVCTLARAPDVQMRGAPTQAMPCPSSRRRNEADARPPPRPSGLRPPGPLAALLAPYIPPRVCSSLTPCQRAWGSAAKCKRFSLTGPNQEQALSAVSNLLPALGQGLARNASSPGGLEGLLGALAGGGHSRYVEDPSTLSQDETVRDGNSILGHILGSKDVSRQVAQQAAPSTGIGADVLKKMLPVVAAMAMGTLSRQVGGPQNAAASSQGGGLMGMLGQFMDGNRDGSVVDNVLGMAAKFFQK